MFRNPHVFLCAMLVLIASSMTLVGLPPWYRDLPEHERAVLGEIRALNGISPSDSIRIIGKAQQSPRTFALGLTLPVQVRRVPAAVTKLKQLQEVTVQGDSSLPQLPSGLAYFTGVPVLRVRECQLDSLITVPDYLAELSQLLVVRCAFPSLPDILRAATGLENLWVDGCELSTVPPEIGELDNLKTLVLWNNQITHLPAEIGKLGKLHKLFLNRNRLEGLPDSFCQLKNLRQLDLSGNRIRSLPDCITGLVEIKWWTLHLNRTTERAGLSIGGNRICSVDSAVAAYLATYAGKDWMRGQDCAEAQVPLGH